MLELEGWCGGTEFIGRRCIHVLKSECERVKVTPLAGLEGGKPATASGLHPNSQTAPSRHWWTTLRAAHGNTDRGTLDKPSHLPVSLLIFKIGLMFPPLTREN